MDLVVTEIPKEVPKICLNMIVKDESHIIEDTLNKLLNKIKIDYWVISDTGSTDKTKEIIVEFFRKKNIKGELFEDKWENFGYNRTKALEHAYKKSEYVLIFDADDEICGDFVVPELKHDLYNFQFGSPSGVSYIRPQLVNNNKRWKYIGVLHEFITCIENNHTSATIIGNYYTVSGRTSNRNKDSNKYLKDALILEKAYEDALKNGDEIYNRYGFYCANSYYDCGKHEEAIKWFKITLANKNWEQEKYVSCLRLYKCYNSLNQKETGMFYLIKAFSYDKERVECLYELVVHYCLEKMNDVAYSYYNIVKSFHNDKYLKSDLVGKLFVDVGIAELYLPYYMILVSDKVGDHETTIQMYRIIFTKKFIESNKFFIGNMLYNLQFFIERVKDDKTFINLFNEYINFLISIDYPIHDHEFMNLYEKYGVVLPKISNQIFSNEVCMESKNILFYTGYSPIKWNHTYGSNNALGGSETAIISLSSNFPKEYKVYISGDVEEETVDNITYINMNNLHNLIKMTAFHTIIVSRYLNFYEIYKNFSAYQTFIWGHDIALFPYGTNLSVESILQKWSSKITGCICQTEWHKNLFISTYPQLNNKITVINNGVNNNMFTQHTRKVNNRFIYTSCTERGLDRLLEIWPLLTKEIPDAELFISSYNNFPINSNEVVLKNIIDSYPNVEHLGKLNKNDLYELMSTAEYWLYPTNFNETSCITAMEMLMSEVICIYYPIAGLVYTLGDYGIPVQRGNEIETILELTTKNKNEIKKRGKEYAISCSWENRANNWIKLINIENKKNQVVFDSNKYSTVTESNSINKNINLSNEEKRIFELYETISMPESHNRILKNISKTFTPKVIYDIGASTLHWTKEVKKIWNDVEIIAFDAIQEAEELYKSQNVKYNIGVLSDQDNKVVNFYENKENPAGNSYYREIGHPNSINIYPENSYKEKVSKTLTTVVKERLFSLPELIKIDVQGAELDILKGGQEIISNAKYLIIELQNIEYNKGAPLANITIDFLIENGWEIVESKFSDNGPDADYLFVNTNYDSIMKNKINIDNTKLDMWKNLNIEPYYNFPVSKNWFGYSEIKKYLLNNIDLTKQYNILEIGSFEGCSSCFFSDILINNSLSTLTCVDPFVSDGCTKTDHSTLKYKFYSNIKKTENYNKINVVEKISDDFYSTYNGSKFNFIYIDGEHSDKQILKDLDACFSLLDINGIIWCDDYNNNWKHIFDSWILLKNDYINIIHSGYQLGFIKIKETKIQKNTINNTEIVNNTGIINSGNDVYVKYGKEYNNIESISDNDINYTIKVINLKHRNDRRNNIMNIMKQENIQNFEFFEAINGKELQLTDDLIKLFERNDFGYKKGVIGCALSHLFLWKQLIHDTSNNFYVILEDDIELCKNFKHYLDMSCKLFVDQKLEHLALGEYNSNKKFPNGDLVLETYKKNLYREWNVTFAYIISKSSAKKALEYINSCSLKCAFDNPQAFGYILNYSSLNVKLVNCEISNEYGSNIQSNSSDNYFNIELSKEASKELTVSFCDWWEKEYSGGLFDFNDNFFTNLLREHGNNYDIKVVDPNENPDILFYSVFGCLHQNYKANKKIFFSGEPYSQRETADFNITFDVNSMNNTRVPLWLCYLNKSILEECEKRKNNEIFIKNREKFCSFIASGSGLANNRKEFIEKLSKYKQVDCGGSYLNNIGYNVPIGLNCSGKIEHNKSYKFAIAFESTTYPGYVTEKICDIYKSNCIPIYWGHQDVVKDFNPKTFINSNDFVNFDHLIEYIIKVDNDEELYKSFFKEPFLSKMWLDILTDQNKCFFKNLADKITCKNTNLFDSAYQLGFIKETKIQKNTINNTGIINSGNDYFKKLEQNIVINNTYYSDNKIEYDIRENKIDITYSQAHQDIFVTNLLQHKKNGYFVEIGTNDPIECNNTYLLEKNYNFKGLLVEYESYYKNKYEQHRPNSIYIIDDARNINYKKVLDDNKFPKNIDYLQIDLDVDNKSTLDTLILLENTVFDTYKFSTITFEHDYYRGNFFNTREISREIFKKRGYLLVFPDVCTDQGCVGTGWQPFEDWYVHPDFVDMNLVNIIKTDKSLRNDHIKNILINASSINSNNCNKSKKMKVIFSNNCSVGDIYFSQPFIKNIVTNNPEHDYYIYHQTCSYYFTDVLKIKDVNKIPELKELLYQVFNFKINLHELVNIDNMSSYIYRYDKTNNILLICTWLGCIRKKYPDMLECNMIKYNDTYKFLVYDLNKELDINLKFDHKLSLDIYPEVPTLNINKFREFKNKNFNKNIIFYYNFLPSSGQSYPVKNYNEHNEIIKNLSENNIVVIPHKQSYKGNTDNVYFADDFLENVEYYDAKNFYYHAQMAYESDYSIYYDLGRGFMSMNKKFIEENNCNIRLHITNNEYFYHSLNTNILIPNDYMKLVNVVDYIDIINKLNEIIKNKNL